MGYVAADKIWTADEFLVTDQYLFGDAWRYELVDGQIVAHDAPAPDHGAIIMGLGIALGTRLRGHPDGCRPEAGSGAVPKRQPRNTTRIPDVMVRCREHPRVTFEVVSPSDLKNRRVWDRRRRDLKDVEGVREIIEIYQHQTEVHAFRREADGTWSPEIIKGADASLRLPSLGFAISLAEIYEFV